MQDSFSSIIMVVLLVSSAIVYWCRQQLMKKYIATDALLRAKEQQLQGCSQRLEAAHTAEKKAMSDLAAIQASQVAQEQAYEEKLELLQNSKQQLSLEFGKLAADLFDTKGKQLSDYQQVQLGHLLQPLKEKLRDFENKIASSYQTESKERLSLLHEIKQLHALNEQMSTEAKQLSQALHGQVKTQGAWGEMILARALEMSGLQQGNEYQLQVPLKTDKGRLLQPDAVVLLPEQRQIIIDAKVTLTAYSRYMVAETAEQQQQQLKLHLQAVRAHVKNLAEKSYQQLLGEQSLDFVLLFMPVEGAFQLAMQNDDNLYQYAWQKNIIIVTATTLLATLRTIENLWRVEKQNRHALTIATKAGNLYDKFAAFCQDIEDLGKKIQNTQKSYDSAINKLTTGKGNLLNRVEELRQLGIKTSKVIPDKLLTASSNDGVVAELNS